jgi:intracellular sulfur oxidation DsrE/DsrF family protein
MKHSLQFKILTTVIALSLSIVSFTAISADKPAKRVASDHEKVIFQVSDSAPSKWNMALNNARNVQELIGKDKVDIEIVAFGPGIDMLKLESEVGVRVDQALTDGVKIVACENTMKGKQLTKDDMLPSISYVPGGVVEIMRKQKAGWAYIHP